MIKRKLKTVVALGFFDGVHVAHRAIVSAAVRSARAMGLEALALSFDEPPVRVLRGEDVPLLTDNGQKARLITELMARCVPLPATRELLAMTGREFAENVLMGQFNIAKAVCGYNYRFGSDGLDADNLAALGGELGFEVEIVPEMRVNGESVSSSRIRELLAQGRPGLAALMLGRPYSAFGKVEKGKGLGHKKGFPTLNIYPGPELLPMPHGVYASRAVYEGGARKAITNLGVNPTVHDGRIRIETHVPGFKGDLYGKPVKIEFLRFIRPEREFASVEELFAQIRRDAACI